MTWLCRRKPDLLRNADLRRARDRARQLEDGQETSPREAIVRDAELRADALEARADKIAETLMDRVRRNNFAEGIAMAWGQFPRHRRGGA